MGTIFCFLKNTRNNFIAISSLNQINDDVCV